jgi:hypothetical protein
MTKPTATAKDTEYKMRAHLIGYLQIPGDDIDPVVGMALPGQGLQGIEEEDGVGLVALKQKIDQELSSASAGVSPLVMATGLPFKAGASLHALVR